MGYQDYYRQFGLKPQLGPVYEAVPKGLLLALPFGGQMPQGTVTSLKGSKRCAHKGAEAMLYRAPRH